MIKEYRVGFWNIGNVVVFGVATWLQLMILYYGIPDLKKSWLVILLVFVVSVSLETLATFVLKMKFYVLEDKIIMKCPGMPTIEMLWGDVKSIKRVWNIYNGFSFWVRSKKNKKDIIGIPDTVIGYEELLQIISEKSGVKVDLKIRL